MSTSRHDPRNRQRPAPNRPSKRTFLIRRLIVLAVLIGLIAAVWAGVAAAVSAVQGFFGGGSASTAAGGTSSVCKTENISLQPKVMNSGGADQAAFDSGINPFFSYTITNIGDSDCSFDLGPAGTYFKVTSGSETIWSSENCDRTGLASAMVTLKPNEPKTATAGEWYRVKSSSAGCGADQEPVTAGGASYHLSVEVGTLKSQDTVQFILN
ncbi:MAG: hypothetical protein RL100_351 [Actinomycetota bacterium]|jgi:hypothetical protein